MSRRLVMLLVAQCMLSAVAIITLLLASWALAVVGVEAQQGTERLLASGAVDVAVLRRELGIDESVRVNSEGSGFIAVHRAAYADDALRRAEARVMVVLGIGVVLGLSQLATVAWLVQLCRRTQGGLRAAGNGRGDDAVL